MAKSGDIVEVSLCDFHSFCNNFLNFIFECEVYMHMLIHFIGPRWEIVGEWCCPK